MTIEIAKARPEEAKAVLSFLRQIGTESDNLTFGREGPPFTEAEEAAYLLEKLTSRRGTFVLAKQGGKILGCASFDGLSSERMKHRGSVSLSVLKSEWGRGIGSLLMEHVIDFAKNTAGAEILSLEVRSDNARAIRLYQKYGFEKVGHYEGFFKIDGVYVDCDLMNLYLYR